MGYPEYIRGHSSVPASQHCALPSDHENVPDKARPKDSTLPRLSNGLQVMMTKGRETVITEADYRAERTKCISVPRLDPDTEIENCVKIREIGIKSVILLTVV